MEDIIDLKNIKHQEIIIDKKYLIPKEMFLETEIKDLKEIIVKGKIFEKSDEELYLELEGEGEMKLSDSITLKDVWFPFSFEISHKIKDFLLKDENYLDIIEVLWQTIVVEVPLRYTLVNNYEEYHGEGWKLISEEESKRNPFDTLFDKDGSD